MSKFTCVNARKKSITIEKKDGTLIADGNPLQNIETIYIFPCTLSIGDCEVVISCRDATHINNKTEVYLRRNWCNQPLGKFTDDEDDKSVAHLNESIVDLFDGQNIVTLSESFEGRVEKTFDMSNVYVTDTHIVSPNAKTILPLKSCDAVFLERVTSYTRTFDVTFICGEKTFTIGSVQRKMYLQFVKNALKQYGVYETGPDPIPWPQMMRRKSKDNLTWKQMHDMITRSDNTSDEDESEWEEGDTDCEEEHSSEEDEVDYPTGEEDESDAYNSCSSTDDDYCLEGNEDYDAYEARQTSKRRKLIADDTRVDAVVKQVLHDMVAEVEKVK